MEDAYPSSYFASNMEIVHNFSSLLLFSLETPRLLKKKRRIKWGGGGERLLIESSQSADNIDRKMCLLAFLLN
jgi:hypothetical protein